MKVKDLSKETLQKVKAYRYDRLVGKHEGPEQWEDMFKYYEPEFLELEGKFVLLPLDKSRHVNITILRTIIDKEDKTLTIFLKDTTYSDSPDDELFMAGFVAICDGVLDENFFITIFYHEWFILEEHVK
jgi:hypothetical protein